MNRTLPGNKILSPVPLVLVHLAAVVGLLTVSCTAPVPSPTAEAIIEATSTPVLTPTPELTEDVRLPIDEIDGLMNNIVDQAPLAGVALGIQFRDKLYTQGYGLADLAAGTPVTPQTVFKIASLTKAITAAAILRLSDEGKLSLDDPIARFFPGTPRVAKGIRVRHLLNHTSGLPDWSIDAAPDSLSENFTTAQAVDDYFRSLEQLDFETGQGWGYNNLGYFLLGAIIEQVSGVPYDEYFQSEFFAPLHLDSSGECPLSGGRLATGYHAVNKTLEAASPSNLKLAGAAGALCSNVRDLLSWQVALTHGRVLRPELWDMMITPETLSTGRRLDYGFGVSIQRSDHGPAVMHEGATAGYNSFFIYYPEHDLNIVLLANTDRFDSHLRAISSRVAAKVLRP